MDHPGPQRRVAYRAFMVNDLGKLSGAPAIIDATDDRDAVLQAGRLSCRRAIEVWEGARLVAYIPTPSGMAPTGSMQVGK